jgi:cytochrome c-type biogenesis protein CcmH
MARLLLALTVVLATALPAAAVDPDEMLDDPALEARARDISAGLRCLVCQNQSIDDSNAPLARDLRILVRERLTAGDTDAGIVDFVVGRYGEFVLLNPRVGPRTYVLWLAPLALLGLGGLVIWRFFGARRVAEPDPLTPEEERRLREKLSAGA